MVAITCVWFACVRWVSLALAQRERGERGESDAPESIALLGTTNRGETLLTKNPAVTWCDWQRISLPLLERVFCQTKISCRNPKLLLFTFFIFCSPSLCLLILFDAHTARCPRRIRKEKTFFFFFYFKIIIKKKNQKYFDLQKHIKKKSTHTPPSSRTYTAAAAQIATLGCLRHT